MILQYLVLWLLIRHRLFYAYVQEAFKKKTRTGQEELKREGLKVKERVKERQE